MWVCGAWRSRGASSIRGHRPAVAPPDRGAAAAAVCTPKLKARPLAPCRAAGQTSASRPRSCATSSPCKVLLLSASRAQPGVGGPRCRDVAGMQGALGCWPPAWHPKQMGGSPTGMGPAVAAWSPEQCDPLQKGAIRSPGGCSLPAQWEQPSMWLLRHWGGRIWPDVFCPCLALSHCLSLWDREDAFVQKGPAAVGEDRLSCARAWGQDIILHGTKSTLMSSRAREEVFHTVI